MNRSPWRLEEVDGSPWRLEEVDGGDEQYPVESRFAVRHTPPDQQDPRFNRRRSVSSVVRYARARFHRLFRPSPPDEHDHAFRSDPAGWLPRVPLPPDEHDAFCCLPMNTSIPLPPHEYDDDAVSPFRPSHVHEPWSYACASRRSRPRPYVHIRGRIFFLAPWPLYVRVHATCAPLLRHVRASTSTSIYVRTRSRPE